MELRQRGLVLSELKHKGDGMAHVEHLREVLLKGNNLYRSLAEQHAALELRLNELTHHQYPSGDDDLEKITLKKKKLHLKDQMEQILQQHLKPSLQNVPTEFES